MKLDVLNVLGKSTSSVELADSVFAIEPHNQAMFDLVLSERAAQRQGTHQVKNRSAVRGGGRKPWRQKGTGRARQGTIRAPQWRGGGVVFGPQSNRNYTLKINKKVKNLALRSGWSIKAKENQIVLVDTMEFKLPKTQDFMKMIKNLKANDRKTLLILSDVDKEVNTFLSARSVTNVMPLFHTDVLLDDILNADRVLMTEATARLIEGGLK